MVASQRDQKVEQLRRAIGGWTEELSGEEAQIAQDEAYVDDMNRRYREGLEILESQWQQLEAQHIASGESELTGVYLVVNRLEKNMVEKGQQIAALQTQILHHQRRVVGLTQLLALLVELSAVPDEDRGQGPRAQA